MAMHHESGLTRSRAEQQTLCGQFAGTRAGGTSATLAGAARGGCILLGGVVARALASGPGAARAAGAADLVLSRRVLADAVERGLLAARALRLLG